MQNEMSFLHLVLGASPVVQLVMLALLSASLASWTMIFDRFRTLKAARLDANYFEDRFWGGGELSELYRVVSRDESQAKGMAIIFRDGFREFAKQKEHKGIAPMAVVEGARRAMQVALNREIERLETYLAFLATVGSISPYVGLFGTVWGIMNAFIALGNVKQATLSMVAPGIAEALIATAIGLFAAIPAVVAYNRFSNDVERLEARYEGFLDEFTTILQRQAH
jgi:biopolymer transport protein TolQ